MARGLKHSAEQIAGILRELEAGKSAAELSRLHGVSDKTIATWKHRFKNTKGNETQVRRVRQLEEENSRLKRMIANMAIDIDALKAINAKKW